MEDVNQLETQAQDIQKDIENKVPENFDDIKALSKEATEELRLEDKIDDKKSEGQKEWAPNYKVKAYDKEFEIPEGFRGFMTKENEKEFRDTFEKAFALEVMKEKNAKIREANEGYQNKIEKELAPVLQRYQKAESYLKKNDFDSFIEAAGVKEADIQAWMLRKLQLKDLPADQQAIYNEKRAADKRAEQLEEENSRFRQTFEQQTNQQKEAAIKAGLDDLDAYTKQPGIEQVAKNFDQRLGQDGSFKLEVLRRAAVVSRQLGRDVSVKEAVDDFVKLLGSQQAAAPTQEAVETEFVPQAQAKPTLPSLSGKATSPAAQKVNNLDDIKRLAKAEIARASRASRQ